MMKLLSKKAVCAKVGFSRAYVDRLTNNENYAKYGFPKPFRLNARVLWSEDELDAWITAQLNKRGATP